jgi:hypothetical protein
MYQITIQYGGQRTSRNYAIAPTVGQIKQDQSLRMELGYGDNVRVMVNAVTQPDHVTLPGGCIVTIETAANTKA